MAACYKLDHKVTGWPVVNNIRFKIKFITHLKTEKKNIDINVLNYLTNPPLKQD